MPRYEKLVRDKIPQTIEQSGKKCRTRVLSDEEYLAELRRKFQEEFEEYKAAGNSGESVEELADLLEILYALAEVHGSSKEQLEEIRARKAAERGGFREKVYLIEVHE